MKVNAEQLEPQPGALLREGDWITLRVENLKKPKINTDRLRLLRLKIQPLASPRQYADTEPDDIEIRVKIDFKTGQTSEGDIMEAKYVTHGGPSQISVYHDQAELLPGYSRTIPVTHFENIEQGDPDKTGLFYFVKQVFTNEDGVAISDEEAWRLANRLKWTEELKESLTKNILGLQIGSFDATYTLGNYFSFLRSLYGGKNYAADAVLGWLNFAEKLAKIYEKLPKDNGRSLSDIATDALRDLADEWMGQPKGAQGTSKGFDIHEYIPRVTSLEEYTLESLKNTFLPPATFKIIGVLPVDIITEPLKQWLNLIHRLIRALYSMTYTQLEYFELLPGKQIFGTEAADQLKYQRLKSLTVAAESFANDPVSYLSLYDKKLLERYTKAGDEEQDMEMGELIIKINQLSEKAIEYYNSGNTVMLNAELAGTDLTEEDIRRFDKFFKYKALGKAFKMLDENERLVKEETEKVNDQENMDYVVSVIGAKRKEMRIAARNLRDGLLKFHKAMPANKQSNLNVYLNGHGINPNEVLDNAAKKHNVDKSEIVSLVGMRGGNYSDYDFSVLNAARGYIREMFLLYGLAMAETWQNYKGTNTIRRTDIFPVDDFDNALLSNFILSPDYPMMFLPEEYNAYLDMFVEYNFPQFRKAQEAHKDAAEYYSGQATFTRKSDGKKVTFNILKDLSFNYAQIGQYSDSDIRKALKVKLEEKKKNVGTVRGYLKDDQDYVYEMSAVLDYTLADAGILKDTNAAKIVYDKVSDIEKAKMWTSIGIGALSLVLAVGGFFTGGTTTALGIALLAGSVALGVTDLVIEYNRYQFGRAVSDTALTEAGELGKVDSNYLGVVLALIGLGIDVFQLVGAFAKVIKASTKAVTFDTKLAGEIFDKIAAGKKTILLKNGTELTRAAFIKKFEEFSALYAPGMKASKAFMEFAALHNIAPMSRPGLFALMKADPEAFDLLGKMGSKLFHAGALDNIGIHLLLEERVAGSLGETIRFFKDTPEITAKIFNAYAGANSKYLGNLPDIWKIINGTDAVKHPALVEKILTEPRYQFKIMDEPDALSKITKRWENFHNNPGKYKNENFDDFLKKGRGAVTFDKGPRHTIADEFADDVAKTAIFSQPGNFRAKNLAILETTEPKLVEAIQNGTFVPGNAKLQNKLNKILDEDLIGTTTDLKYARSKIVRRINETIGENVDIGELRSIRASNTPGEVASQGSIFESWIRKNYQNIGGKNSLLGKKTFKNVQGTADEAIDITFDSHYVPKEKVFVGQEFKSGDGVISGRDIQQAKRYNDLVLNPNIYGYEKVFIEYVFLNEDAARKSLGILKKNISEENLRVFFVDQTGKMIKL